MNTKNILLFTILPTYNRKEYLRKILSQLYNQDKGNFILEIVVIVDGSTDGTFEMLENDFPDVHVVKGTGDWWYTKSMNKGFKYAEKFQPDYILTLNDDVVIEKNYVQSIFCDIKKVERDSIMGSASFTISKPHRISFSGVYKFISWRLKEYHYIKKYILQSPSSLSGIKPSVVLPGRGMLIPFEILKQLNYFDENFVQYGSDTDFTLRAYRAGIKVYISYNSVIFENEKLTSKGAAHNSPAFIEFLKSYFNRYSTNSIHKSYYFWKKHGVKILFPLYFIILFLGIFKVYFFKYRKN